MKKVLICWVCCLTLVANAIQAQEAQVADTSKEVSAIDTTVKEVVPAKETPAKVEASKSEAVPEPAPAREWDNRWFISPLKFQLQEFGMIEKNKLGFASDANQLPFMDKVNGSIALSVYKNIVGRLSFSIDAGFAYGHVAGKNKLISTTKKETYNLLNGALYYHLLSHKYKLQPYITVGINNLINDSNYTSVPAGIGLKFNSKKIMVMAQAAYGYSISKTTANSLNYSLGVYIPITSRKRKKAEKEKAAAEAAKKEQEEKEKAEKEKKAKDSAATAGVVNNIVINLNVDSIINAKLKEKGLDGNNANNGNGQNGGIDTYGLDELNGNLNSTNGKNGGRNDANGSQNGNGRNGSNSSGRVTRNGKTIHPRGGIEGSEDYGDSLANGKAPHAFDLVDYQIDTVNGKPVIRFMIYFYYKDYALTSRAFSTVDKVIAQLKRNGDKVVDVKGYTDNVGSTDYNNDLSMKRAQMTMDYMISRGIKLERVIMSYYGKEYPVAENTPQTAWLNRRVEIVIHEKD